MVLESKTGTVYAQGEIDNLANEWKRISLNLKSTATDPAAKLVIYFSAPGTLWLDFVSLLP